MDTRQLQTVTHPGGDQSDHSENEHGHQQDHFKHDPTPSPPDNGPQHGSVKTHEGNIGQARHQHYTASSHLPGVLDPAPDPVTSDLATSVTTVNQLLDFESIPAIANGAPDLFCRSSQDSPDNVDTNMNTLYSEEDRITNGDANCKLDSKNSRRKMDKPRKRKRDSTDTDNESDIFHQPNMKNSACAMADNATVTSLAAGAPSVPHAKTGALNGASGSCASSIRPDSVHSTITPTSPTAVTPKSVSTPLPEDLTVQITSPAAAVTSPGLSTPSSVQIPHTPRLNGALNDSDRWPIESACASGMTSYNADVVSSNSSSVRDLEEVMNKHLPVSAQMDAELRHEYAQSFLGGYGKHKSTIQWVGSNNAGTTPDMTASNLLRSLYANRETVIRTNVYNPRPQYYSDMQTSLLTPPGATTDPYKDSFQMIAAHSKNQPATYTGLSYPTNSLSVSMPAGIPEGFNMTPPSSVSPHEKYQTSLGEQIHYGSDAMPLKPQAYPLPAHANSSLGAFDRTGANQYVPYYGNGPGLPSYGHTVHYREPTKNGAW